MGSAGASLRFSRVGRLPFLVFFGGWARPCGGVGWRDWAAGGFETGPAIPWWCAGEDLVGMGRSVRDGNGLMWRGDSRLARRFIYLFTLGKTDGGEPDVFTSSSMLGLLRIQVDQSHIPQ
ncbi:hypothetical protein QBC33DRAFT_529002 [Phialemonium atrogriseum]|uniref:Secreted protein n=1 Tax=Phialemonium atrogriseum TaxID=1093897 RepID=A0AAJ0FS11_9PEZI|nr:uncharacterized protein QBC33DRAFT_529002 [Phialemonium atrogriseum]KAK1770700.1 hypothetical protein QBC33DRAFT_529002 [Phialemonium atrogriseum]